MSNYYGSCTFRRDRFAIEPVHFAAANSPMPFRQLVLFCLLIAYSLKSTALVTRRGSRTPPARKYNSYNCKLNALSRNAIYKLFIINNIT